MNQTRTIILIDSDFRRRAAVTHSLSGSGIHIEPFEGFAEIRANWPRGGVVLACDEGDLIRDLHEYMTESGRWLPVVAYGTSPSTPRVVRAVLGGALDYLDWPITQDAVASAMDLAAATEHTLGNLRLREAMARSRIQKLTRREREVLAGVADGLSNRLIGERLAISPRTVEIHRANMLTKIGASHTSEAIRIAIEASLVA